MNLGHQLWSSNLPPKRIIGIIGYHSAILHGNHFTFPSQKLFSILSLCLLEFTGRLKAYVFEPSTPQLWLDRAAFFTQHSLFTYNFSSKQLLHWGRKLAQPAPESCLLPSFFGAAVILLPGSKVKIMMDLQREDASAICADGGISWWLNQPIGKICTSNLRNLPQNRGENTTVFETNT